MERAVAEFGREFNERCAELESEDKLLESHGCASARVRHGDAARGRVLPGIENYSRILRPAAGRAPVLPDRLLPEGLRLLHRRVAPDRAADRRHVRGRPLAQVDAGRLRLPAAVRDGQPPADFRGVPLHHAAARVRVRHPGAYEREHSGGWSSRSCADRHRRSRGRGARDPQPDRQPDGEIRRRVDATSACWSRR